jgi:hypothetical protein
MRKGFAPLCALLGYAVGLLIALLFTFGLSRRQRNEEIDFNFSGWWTDELAAGILPAAISRPAPRPASRRCPSANSAARRVTPSSCAAWNAGRSYPRPELPSAD